MEKEKYFSVQEFAKMVGISRQTVYNSKRLQPYIKVVNGCKVVCEEALQFYEKNNAGAEGNVNDTVKALQVQYNKLYKELEQLRQYKADREELDKKILVALERFKHEKEVTKMLKEQKKRDDQIIDDLMQRNKKQAELLEQANVLKLLEIRK